MKKILTIFLAASLLLVACGKDKEKEETKETKQEVVATEEQQVVKSVEVSFNSSCSSCNFATL